MDLLAGELSSSTQQEKSALEAIEDLTHGSFLGTWKSSLFDPRLERTWNYGVLQYSMQRSIEEEGEVF